MIRFGAILLLLTISTTYATDNFKTSEHSFRFLKETSRFLHRDNHTDDEGTRWAVLIAGSKGWINYRHQADVCHAYQILKRGGLKDENIIVFMYDDIAHNARNPNPGVIINKPHGPDVYHGVPKDYTGKDVNGDNFFNVILGNKSAVTGGSGKVVNSRPNDHIFIFYSDHGSPMLLGMPDGYIVAQDLNKVLKKKHASGTYKSMVFYLEACEAGSMFDGQLPKNISIFATTASNPYESSYGCYCPDELQQLDVCLGDLYSVSWMEDSDKHNTQTETLQQQYEVVKTKTARSHVMEYGDLGMGKNNLSVYLGSSQPINSIFGDEKSSQPRSLAVNQRDADLIHFHAKFRRAPEGSPQKLEAKKEVVEAMRNRIQVDSSVEMIGKLLFGSEKGPEVLKTIRPAGTSPVDDWDCFKALLRTFEAKCGKLTPYARKHSRAIANICNAGIREGEMAKAAEQACSV